MGIGQCKQIPTTCTFLGFYIAKIRQSRKIGQNQHGSTLDIAQIVSLLQAKFQTVQFLFDFNNLYGI